jgi:hypothetical protein
MFRKPRLFPLTAQTQVSIPSIEEQEPLLPPSPAMQQEYKTSLREETVHLSVCISIDVHI